MASTSFLPESGSVSGLQTGSQSKPSSSMTTARPTPILIPAPGKAVEGVFLLHNDGTAYQGRPAVGRRFPFRRWALSHSPFRRAVRTAVRNFMSGRIPRRLKGRARLTGHSSDGFSCKRTFSPQENLPAFARSGFARTNGDCPLFAFLATY